MEVYQDHGVMGPTEGQRHGVEIKRIAILGMGRSGTSFLARFLAGCGVYVDEVPDKYEHPLARRINDSILEELFGARRGLPYGSLPAQEIQVPEIWHAQVKEFIEYMDGQISKRDGLSYWAFKDPRTTVLHSLWVHHFHIIVGIFRAPEQVVESYLAKGWISGWRKRQTALNYWLRFNQSLLEVWKNIQGTKPMYVIDYNDDVPAQTMRLCEELGIPVPGHTRELFDRSKNHFADAKTLNDRDATRMHDTLLQICNLL